MTAALTSLHICLLFSVSLMSSALAQDENQFIYHGFSESKLHLDGMAKILSNGLLLLTNNFKLQSGRAFYPFQLKLNRSSSHAFSFSTNFVFAKGFGPFGSQSMASGGHGMAFVISPSMDFSKAVAGAYLGVFNISNDSLSTNQILAVELDTMQSPEFNDINRNHVGIDINSLISNQSARASYFSDKEGEDEWLELASGHPVQIWVDYDGAEKLLNVTLAQVTIPKPNRPLLSKLLDLSQILLDSMYVGFSAATETTGNYDYILGWSFNRTGQAQNLDLSKLPQVPLGSYSSVSSSSSESGNCLENYRRRRMFLILIPLLLTLILITGATYMVMKKKYEEVYEDWEREYAPQRLPYKNLYTATKGFKDTELIGRGGFGKVYKGVLPCSNVQIAVKRISHDSEQGMKEFVSEIASMGRLRHRNLVKLLGYCSRKGEFLLVYDYMPNGSLDKMLYNNTTLTLSWFQRLRIIRGIASGLLYLHEDWEKVVLHRDIKPGNVLLDADLNGKLGDFGLARLHDHGSNPQTTKLVGTFGYLDPELKKTGKATTCTDVYAFGVFMLEVACGKRTIEQQGWPETGNLIYWVTGCWERGSILDASDPRLAGVYVEDQMEMVLKLGLYCSHSNPAARPSMRQVTQYLDGDAKLPDIPSASAVLSFFTAHDAAPDGEVPFSSLLGNASVATMSTIDSILVAGR